MHREPIVFALSNPDPQITPEAADRHRGGHGHRAVRLSQPDQQRLVFPGFFRGALDAGPPRHGRNEVAAAEGHRAVRVSDDELSPGYIVPSVFNLKGRRAGFRRGR